MFNGRKIIASMPLIALAGACTTVGVLALTVFRPDAVLDHGVEAALTQVAEPTRKADAAPSSRQALADSPNFLLSRLDDELSLGLSKPVQTGDRIEISGRNGRRTLEVVDIREIGPSLTRIESTPGPRFLLVSCREVGSSSPRLVRFIIEAGELQPAGIGEPQHTL